MDKLIILDNLDCFRKRNFIIENFISIERCIETCKKNTIFVFVIYNNIVYYRNNSIEDCIKNIVYFNNAKMYILNNKFNFYHISDLERKKIYTQGLFSLKKDFQFDLNHKYYKTKDYFNKYLNNDENKSKWIYQHHKNLWEYFKLSNYDITECNMNPYDINWSQPLPTFTKSRRLKIPQMSVLLPLEKLYIPSFYAHILNDDISFHEKENNCVWRGINSGDYFTIKKERASRKDLVSKFSNHDKFNIGLSCVKYKEGINENYIKEAEKHIRSFISTKEQLQYKYILSVEGNDFATNLSWIMLSNSVPLMPIPYVETWKMESKLIPYIHYVPLKNDFSDLEQIIEWCNNNQEKCEYIAFMSKAYALQFFNKEKEEQIIKSVIDFYYEKTHQNVL